MAENTQRVSALEGRIAQGEADPISPAEKILVAELREGFERRFGAQKAPVTSASSIPSASALPSVSEYAESSKVATGSKVDGHRSNPEQLKGSEVDLAAVMAEAIRDHASGEADLSGFPLEVSVVCTVADALIEGLNAQYLNPLTGKSRELMAGEISFPDMLDAIDFIKKSCNSKLNSKED